VAAGGNEEAKDTVDRNEGVPEVIMEGSPLFHPIMRWRKEYCHPLTIMSRSYQSEAKQRQTS
jgi:hypothetical protein